MRRQHVLLAMEDDATRRLYSTEDAHYQEVPYVLKAQGEEEDEDFSANAVGLSKAAQLTVSRPARLSETCYREEQMLETWCANDAPNLDALSCEVHNSNTTIDVYREPLVPGEAPFASCRTLWFGGTQNFFVSTFLYLLFEATDCLVVATSLHCVEIQTGSVACRYMHAASPCTLFCVAAFVRGCHDAASH